MFNLTGEISVESTLSKLSGECMKLLEVYHKKWNDSILESGQTPIAKSSSSINKEIVFKVSQELSEVMKNLNKLNINLNHREYELLENLWQGHDVVISCYAYEKISPMLFGCLQRNLHEGWKIIVLFDSTKLGEKEGDDIREWIRKWLSANIFATSPAKMVLINDFKRNEDILIASVRELIDYGIDDALEWFREVKVIVVLNSSEIIFPDILSANALLEIINDLSFHKPQLIMLSTYKIKNIEDAAKGYLKASPKEQDFISISSPMFCYAIWKLERSEPYQYECNLQGLNYLGVEPILALPANNDGIKPIHMSGMENSPWKEYIEEFDNRLQLCQNIDNTLIYHTFPSIKPIDDYIFFISRDDIFNVMESFQRTICFGKKGGIVHIVCPPYILRDYFADNFNFFYLEEPLRSIAPILEKDKATIAYCLMERLLASKLSEDLIKRYLESLKKDYKNADKGIEHILNALFIDIFGVDIIKTGYLVIESSYQFDNKNKRFKKMTFLRLSDAVKEKLKDFAENYYKIVDENNEPINIIPENHIYQNYLQDQTHSFKGEPAKIKDVDHSSKTINTEHRVIEGDVIYRAAVEIYLREAKLSKGISSFRVKNGSYILEIKKYEIVSSFRNTKYFQFMKGINFNSGFKIFELDNEKSSERKHVNNKMLEITIQHNANRIENAAEISFTFALLMNEIFLTLFPKTYQYIKATTPYKVSKDSLEYIFDIVPNLKKDKHLTESEINNSICIYVIEDSQKDMGLINSVKENRIYIFEIIEDYLEWLLGKDISSDSFLCFGYGEIKKGLMLQEVKTIIENLLEGQTNTLKKRRKNFINKYKSGNQDENEKLEKRICFFCGEEMSQTIFEKIADGRERCPTCRDNTINGLDEFTRLFKEVKQWMVSEYKILLRDDIKLKVVGKDAIDKIADEKLIPTASLDGRIVGIACKEGEKLIIYMENEHPYDLSTGLLVHSLTHIWQFENLDFKKMKSQSGNLLIEGHAVYTAINYLKSKGIINRIYKDIESREDDYGKGYLFTNQMIMQSDEKNPFVILKNKYPRF
ncbi:MAG: hypothetical protein HQK79_22205 [Desulfobacterales bacterium]|nr:hypothetical protein [Desulfobacterales bacterium]